MARRSFWFLVPTQFLGAFNDNAFKQLILLLAIDRDAGEGTTQAVAAAVFSLPFVLFSGIAGTLSDRYSKTSIVRGAKVAEIMIMAVGALAFWLRDTNVLLLTLFLMGTQSAFFGPAKYGILPEMLPKRSLSRANGIILTTTFLAIILGQAAAGRLGEYFPFDLYFAGLFYVLLAVAGALTALGVARVEPAQPGLPVRGRPFGDLIPTLRRVRRDRALVVVFCTNSYFWFLGGAMQMTVNQYGRTVMELDRAQTSDLLVVLSLGLAAGGILGGILSRGAINFRLTEFGIWGVVSTLALLTVVHPSPLGVAVVLFVLGASGSLFALPLQTFIQERARSQEKGRVVAASNFLNWVFIFVSAGYFGLMRMPVGGKTLPVEWIPGSLALLTLAVGLFVFPKLRAIASDQ